MEFKRADILAKVKHRIKINMNDKSQRKLPTQRLKWLGSVMDISRAHVVG